MKYIKKQEEIEAVQVRKDNFEEIENFVEDARLIFRSEKYIGCEPYCEIALAKNGFSLRVAEGDYIVKCNDGKLSAYKKEEFEREYCLQQTPDTCKEQENTTEKIIQRLQGWVVENYDPFCCGWTAARSIGNSAGVFNDGALYARSWDAYNVAMILGMAVNEPVIECKIK